MGLLKDLLTPDLSHLTEGQLAEHLAGWRLPACPSCGWWGYEPIQFAVGDPPGPGESPEHEALKAEAADWLQGRRYVVHFERWYRLSRPLMFGRDGLQRYVRIDVVGGRGRVDVVAIECGGCQKRKLEALTYRFAEVWHWPYGADEPRRVPPSRRYPRLSLRRGRPPLPEWLTAERGQAPISTCPRCDGLLIPAE